MSFATTIFAAAAITLLLPRLLLFIQVSTTFIAWPWQFDYTEGVNLNATVQLAQAHNIYQHNGPDSFISAPYPPIFYLLTAPVTWLTGPSFAFGRTLSLLATIAIAFLLIYAIRRVTSRSLPGLLAAVLWLSLSPVIVWGALYTQHIIALMFGFAALVLAMLHPFGRRLYLAAFLLALAFYTKQSAIDAGAAIAVWLVLGNRRTGLRFIVALVALIGLPFLLANLLLNGGLWEHIFSNQALPWNSRRFQRLLGRLWGEYWPVLGLGTICALGTLGTVGAPLLRTLRARSGRATPGQVGTANNISSPWMLAVIYFAIAQVSVLVRLGRDGVNYNHMIDALLPACLLMGLSLGHLFTKLETVRETHQLDIKTSPSIGARVSSGGYLGASGLTVMLGAVVLAQTFSLADPHTWYSGGWPDQRLDGQMQALSKIALETSGDIYSEDAYLALKNGHPVLYDDPFMFVNLAEQGRWDDAQLTRSFLDRRFGVVFLQSGSTRMTASDQAAFDNGYDLKFPDVLNTYIPRLVPREPEYLLSCSLADKSDEVGLEGYSLAPGVQWNGIRPGDTLRLTLYWNIPQKLKHNYASFVHMLDAAGKTVAGQDNPQTGASQPPVQWKAGETVTDAAALPLNTNVPAGHYSLVAGIYSIEAGTIHALPPSICEKGAKYGDAILLGSVDVK